jgi:Zn-dependent peptidase ImmA (M78 family)
MLARLFLVALAVSAAPAQSLFQQVDGLVKTLSEITGWKVHRKVPSEMLSKEKFRQYVESRMKDSSNKEEIRTEEITLKMFGFVPPDFNLASETVDLVSEQAAAFYDYNKKRLFVLDSTSEGLEQRVALAHELAHALADQQHPLGKFLNKGSPDDDAETAREAVMEGQATFLAWAVIAKTSEGVDLKTVIEKLSKDSANDSSFPVFSKEPLYMRESLVFPYDEGLKFQYAIWQKHGTSSFDELFTHPPQSTQQIMHPEDYLTPKQPLDPKPPALEKSVAKKFKLRGEGSMGEFDHNILFRTWLPEKEAVEAAAHWRGGNYKLYEHKREKYPVLAYISEWDSPESARHAFEMYQQVMHKRSKKIRVDQKGGDQITGTADTGGFRLWLSGTTVQSLEGLRTDEDKLRH